MTFSLLGRCASTGALGMVVSSSSTALAARCASVTRVADPATAPAPGVPGDP